MDKKLWLLGGVLGTALAVVPRLMEDRVPGARDAVHTVVRNLPFILIALCVPMALFFLPRYRRSQALANEGVKLMEEGRVAAALERFEASRPLAKNKALPTFNVAIARLQLWQMGAAERELRTLVARPDLTPQFRAIVFAALALVAALEGRKQAFAEHLARAQAPKLGPVAMAVFASAVMACREERWREAWRLLSDPLLAPVTGPWKGLRNALEVWCAEHLDHASLPVNAIAVFGEASSDSLRTAWPELVAFLEEFRQVRP